MVSDLLARAEVIAAIEKMATVAVDNRPELTKPVELINRDDVILLACKLRAYATVSNV